MASDDPDDPSSAADLIALAGIHVVFSVLCFAGAYLRMHSVLEGGPEPRQP